MAYMKTTEGGDVPKRVRSTIGQYGIVPLWIALHPKLSHVAVRLYALMAARYADRDDQHCHPTRRQMSEDLNVARSTIDLALSELKNAKALRIDPHYGTDGHQMASDYTLHPERPEELPDESTDESTDEQPSLPLPLRAVASITKDR